MRTRHERRAEMPLQVIHARSGVPYEIMGLMQGKVVGNALVIMDSFALPVQGTETRVNAANEANEFMVQYIESSEKVRHTLTTSSAALIMASWGHASDRRNGWRMRSGGTTPTPVTAAGFPASTSARR